MVSRTLPWPRDSLRGMLRLTVVVCSTLILWSCRFEPTSMFVVGGSQQLQARARGRVGMSYVNGDMAEVMRSDKSWSSCRVVSAKDDGSLMVKIDGTALTKVIKGDEVVRFLRYCDEAVPQTEKVKGFRFKFDADDLNQLRLTFSWIDVGGKGLIDLSGLTRGFKLFPGPYGKLNKEEVSHVFEVADVNKDGFIDVTEFVFWVMRTNREMEAFHVADLDGDGLIDIAEFRHAVKTTHPKCFPPAIDALFASADVNSDGKISFVEFIKTTYALGGETNKA